MSSPCLCSRLWTQWWWPHRCGGCCPTQSAEWAGCDSSQILRGRELWRQMRPQGVVVLQFCRWNCRLLDDPFLPSVLRFPRGRPSLLLSRQSPIQVWVGGVDHGLFAYMTPKLQQHPDSGNSFPGHHTKQKDDNNQSLSNAETLLCQPPVAARMKSRNFWHLSL